MGFRLWVLSFPNTKEDHIIYNDNNNVVIVMIFSDPKKR